MPALKTYVKGGKVRIDMTFNKSGTLTDPTTITLNVSINGAASTSYTYAGGDIVKSSTGKFYMELALATAGTYEWYVVSTGVAPAAAQGLFVVEEAIA